MSAEADIMRVAAELDSRAQHRALTIRSELEDLEKRMIAIEAELHSAKLVSDRFAGFTVHSGSSYQCPRCWIEDEAKSPLSLSKGGAWRQDFLQCHACNLEINLTNAT